MPQNRAEAIANLMKTDHCRFMDPNGECHFFRRAEMELEGVLSEVDDFGNVNCGAIVTDGNETENLTRSQALQDIVESEKEACMGAILGRLAGGQ